MKLGLMLGYWFLGPEDPIDLVREAEALGYDSVWTAEAYGSDAISTLSWMGARTSKIKLGTSILQISARTPACVAMTAMTIDHLSGGRLILGVGVSGPQVVEGWYGQPFPRPLGRTREFIEIVRGMLRREGPFTYEGQHYQLPLKGGSGLGKPLKLINKPLRSQIPIYVGAEGPKNVAMAAEIAEGWLPMFYSPYRSPALYVESLAAKKPGFDVAVPVQVVIAPTREEGLIPIKWTLTFYIGGMGARGKNFHRELIGRMGFGEEAARVQDLFLAGKRDEAFAAVPDELADEISLVGPPERIRERLDAWRKSPATSLILMTRDPEVLRLVANAI
jgi:F420-dependent oxidoreductase-like protein